MNSVIMSITNFWCSVLHLPKHCLEEIESLCNVFLWSGSPNIHTNAKVAWDKDCYRKSKGGLDIRKLKYSSTVYALSLIWGLLTNAGSLWEAWVKEHLLKHKSFWEVKDATLGLWIWQKLLKLRDQASKFFRWEIQSGNRVSF